MCFRLRRSSLLGVDFQTPVTTRSQACGVHRRLRAHRQPVSWIMTPALEVPHRFTGPAADDKPAQPPPLSEARRPVGPPG